MPFCGIAVRRVLQNGCHVAALCNFELFLFIFSVLDCSGPRLLFTRKGLPCPPSTAGALSGVGGDASPAHPFPTAPASPSVSFAPPPRSLWPPRSLGRPGEPRRWRGKVDDAFLRVEVEVEKTIHPVQQVRGQRRLPPVQEDRGQRRLPAVSTMVWQLPRRREERPGPWLGGESENRRTRYRRR
jgi:hypothetical protein